KTFGHLPNQRRLNKNILNEALTLQKIKPNKKLLLQDLSAKSGNTILLKDITNISRYKESFTNELSSCIPILQKYNCQYEILIEDNEFRGIFFQNNTMKSNFAAFPEIVFLDGTYKLLNFNGVVYLFLVEDSVGSSEIAAVGILVGELKEYIDWLISSFKIKNENSNLINSFMTDKDENMRNVLNHHFPEANLTLCKFHVFQIFKREINTNKLGISSYEESLSREYLQKISYSQSSEEYDTTYGIMIDILPSQVMQYYNINWHPIKKQWVDGFICNNFLNFTNNRTESLNRNLKSIIKKLSSLQEFLEYFFVELQVERTERDHRAIKTIHKLPVINSEIAPIKIYSNILTQFAFNHLEKEYLASVDLKNNSDVNFNVTVLKCSCNFNRNMGLPCRHIFKMRIDNKLDIFDEKLCLPRWTKKYLLETQNSFQPLNNEDNLHDSIIRVTPNLRTPKSTFEKYKHASSFTNRLSQLISEVGQKAFNHRIGIVKQMLKIWESNKEFIILPIDDKPIESTQFIDKSVVDLKINDIINDDQQDLISANVNYCNDEINLQKGHLLDSYQSIVLPKDEHNYAKTTQFTVKR
ncbi:protein FAR-RED IMPAIRED RESPONSE 1-like, partial [Aphis craccivora]